MTISIDWFANTNSDKWKQANGTPFKQTDPSFFDYLYIYRIDNHRATNIAIGILATLIVLSILAIGLSFHPTTALFFKGCHIAGSSTIMLYLLLATPFLYIKYRLHTVEKTDAVYYKALDAKHEYLKRNPPPLTRGEILYQTYAYNGPK